MELGAVFQLPHNPCPSKSYVRGSAALVLGCTLASLLGPPSPTCEPHLLVAMVAVAILFSLCIRFNLGSKSNCGFISMSPHMSLARQKAYLYPIKHASSHDLR